MENATLELQPLQAIYQPPYPGANLAGRRTNQGLHLLVEHLVTPAQCLELRYCRTDIRLATQLAHGLFAVLAVVWLRAAWPVIPAAARPLLVAAGACLGVSLLVDVVWRADVELRLLVEDGAKFAGIWLWASVGLVWASIAVTRPTSRTMELHG